MSTNIVGGRTSAVILRCHHASIRVHGIYIYTDRRRAILVRIFGILRHLQVEVLLDLLRLEDILKVPLTSIRRVDEMR